MNKAKTNAIFYIDVDNGFYYGGTQMLTLAFPRDVIADQDIYNREKFYTLVKSFIETNKLEPANLILIFGPTLCFDKHYEGATALTEKDNQEIKDFIDKVPFEDVLSRQYKLGKRISVVAINNDLATGVKVAFEKEKFTVLAVVPYSILQLITPELTENVDFDLMLSRFDAMRQHNMIVVVPQIVTVAKGAKEAPPKTSPAKLLGLIGVFAVLLVIMAVMFYNNIIVEQPKESGVIGGGPSKRGKTADPNSQTPVKTTSENPSPQPVRENTVPLQNNPQPPQVNQSTPSGTQL